MDTFGRMTEIGHERVCFHHDEATGLRAIVAIHSTKLGPALGGTRRWHYATEEEALYDVMRLSEGMSCKAACAGLPMGGAKSVILLPEVHTKATEAEAKAMGRFIDTFNGDYIAAEDVGLDPQYIDWMATETNHVMGGETVSTGGDPSPFTAAGTFNAMKACLQHLGRAVDFAGLNVAVQGLGHVGMDLCRRLHDAGANLLVADINSSVVDQAVASWDAKPIDPQSIIECECDILAPCALGAVIGEHTVARIKADIICGAANNILVDPARESAAMVDRGILYAPDFVANAGGLIWLAGLWLGMSREELDRRNDEIEQTMIDILNDAPSHASTWEAAMSLARVRFAQGESKEPAHAG